MGDIYTDLKGINGVKVKEYVHIQLTQIAKMCGMSIQGYISSTLTEKIDKYLNRKNKTEENN